MNSMLSVVEATDKTIATLHRRIDDMLSRSDSINLGEWIHYFTFDYVGEVVFGTTFGFLEAGSDIDDCIRTITSGQYYLAVAAQIPWLDELIRHPLWTFLPWTKRNDLLVADKALAEVRKRMPFRDYKKSARNDILDQLIEGHLKNPDRLGEESIGAVAIGAIFAGSDSTTSTLQAFFYLLLKHPKVYNRVVKELDDAEKFGLLKADLVDYASLQNLAYFQAALKESMRLKPAFGSDMVRVVPPEGMMIDGNVFRGGTELALNAMALHRDSEIFGEDCDIYRPERWLEDEKKARLMNRHMYQFGGGSHLCLGRKLALLEMNRVMPALLLRYHFDFVTPNQQLEEKSLVFVHRGGLITKIKRRM